MEKHAKHTFVRIDTMTEHGEFKGDQCVQRNSKVVGNENLIGSTIASSNSAHLMSSVLPQLDFEETQRVFIFGRRNDRLV